MNTHPAHHRATAVATSKETFMDTPPTGLTAQVDPATPAECPTRPRRRLARTIAALTALLALVGIPVLTATPADASVAYCGDGHCTVYFSINETKAIGAGQVPAPPSWVPWQIRTAYYVSAYAHRWFANQYGRQNMCSAFSLDIRPWATQGYWGYRCDWWR